MAVNLDIRNKLLRRDGVQIYFVTAGLKEELSVIRDIQPPNILCSYWYFKNKRLSDLCDYLNYRPNILLDSGAYSAFTKGKSVNVLDYIDYIQRNFDYIEHYVSLDVIGDTYLTWAFYDIMKYHKLNPIPVYHYGDPLELLHKYVERGEQRIALGATAPIKNKTFVADWCIELKGQFPAIEFHLLGSSSKKVVSCGALSSCDSTAWYIRAVNGLPKSIAGRSRTSKIERAKYHMKKMMEMVS